MLSSRYQGAQSEAGALPHSLAVVLQQRVEGLSRELVQGHVALFCCADLEQGLVVRLELLAEALKQLLEEIQAHGVQGSVLLLVCSLEASHDGRHQLLRDLLA